MTILETSDFPLLSQTNPEWLDRVLGDLDELLLDHAHCEKKAASTALGLIFRYPDFPQLAKHMSILAREELRHFEEVISHIQRRGREFGRQLPSPYAAELFKACRKEDPLRLFDTLLIGSLIEARSCERMGILAQALKEVDSELADFYGNLLASEARHYRSYINLALVCCPELEPTLKGRLQELAEHEQAVIERAPSLPRMHC